MLHQPPDRPKFLEYLDNSLKESNISNMQVGDFNINLLRRHKMQLNKEYYDSYREAPPLLAKYMNHCLFHTFHQFIAEPKRTSFQAY